jgi:hypothetical protein
MQVVYSRCAGLMDAKDHECIAEVHAQRGAQKGLPIFDP